MLALLSLIYIYVFLSCWRDFPEFPHHFFFATSRCCAAFIGSTYQRSPQAPLKAIHGRSIRWREISSVASPVVLFLGVLFHPGSWGCWGVFLCVCVRVFFFLGGGGGKFSSKKLCEQLFWMVLSFTLALNFFFFSSNFMGCFKNQLLPLWPQVWDNILHVEIHVGGQCFWSRIYLPSTPLRRDHV